MEQEDWIYPGVDPERANVARVYDALLGGTHNFTADQEVARALTAIEPRARDGARANRAFLRRAVRFLADAGIRQFLDIGSGVPTEGNVHEIARAVAPESRVVYVDTDPVAIAHSRSILAGDDRATIIEADLREPETILDHPDLGHLIDLDRPVGLLLVAILHFIGDEENPGQLIKHLTRSLASGSHLAISHATHDGRDASAVRAAVKVYSRVGHSQPRSHEAVHAFFDGLDLVEPGLVFLPQWHPDGTELFGDRPERSMGYGGIGRKR